MTVPSEGTGVFVSVGGGEYIRHADLSHRVRLLAPARQSDGTWALVTASDGNGVQVWSMPAGTLRKAILHPCPVTAIAMAASPGGRDVLLTGGSDGRVREWNLPDGEPRILTEHSGEVTALALNDHWTVSAGADRGLRVWDRKTRALDQVIALPEPPVAVSLRAFQELYVAFGWEVACYVRSVP